MNLFYPCSSLFIFAAFFSKVSKPTKIFEFILDILSEPRYSSIITWDGSSGQFTITQPHQVAGLWGDRNGRPNMTYQKFTRALRYYYHKKVLAKVRGRKYTYQFNIRELERQYGYQGFTFSRATSGLLPITAMRFPPLEITIIIHSPTTIFPPLTWVFPWIFHSCSWSQMKAKGYLRRPIQLDIVFHVILASS